MTADPAGAVTLQLSCSKCGQGINLWCEGWNEGGQPQPINYACPCCGVNQQAEIPATRVSPSHRDDDLVSNIIISTIISGL
jgi:hypothetical protein